MVDMADTVTFKVEFGHLKMKLKVFSTTLPLELKHLVAAKLKRLAFSITESIDLTYYDTDLTEWFVVDEDYTLLDRDTLRVIFTEVI